MIADATSGRGTAPFRDGGRRLIIYVIWDRRGQVEDYVLHALSGLRTPTTDILAVVNGKLAENARERLAPLVSDVLVRRNRGFDIWAHKEALDYLGDGVGDYDEIVMTNDTWFGPVRPYAPVFEDMDRRSVDFWGMTDHAREEPNPFTGEGVLHYHLQSFWIAVRPPMFLSQEWRTYWAELPEMPDYFDAVLKHEVVFTHRFAELGFVHDVAFPSASYPTDHPALFNADLLIDDGCPLVKRRPFFHYPPFLDRHAVIGRELLDRIAAAGYPTELILDNLSRNVSPRIVNTNAGMLEVFGDRASDYDETNPPRLAVLLHVSSVPHLDPLLDLLVALPVCADLYVSAVEGDVADAVDGILSRRDMSGFGTVEVRAIPKNPGRHMAAFFVGHRDVIENGSHDLLLLLHAKSSVRKSRAVSAYFSSHQIDNLIGSPGFFANLLGLFQREPGLGAVFPPTIRVGIPATGSAWSVYRGRVADTLKSAGVKVPLDGASIVAPLGGMLLGRREAVRTMLYRTWTYEDYAPSVKYTGISLAQTQERMVVYTMGEHGFHCRTVLNSEHAAVSHTQVEFELDQLLSTTPGYPVDQISFFHQAGWAPHGGIVGMTRMYIRANHPRVARFIEPVYYRARRVVILCKGLARRVLRRGDEN